LILQNSVPTPKLNGGTSTHFTSITSNKHLSKFLLLANDSSLYFITKDRLSERIHTPGIISSAQFSEDEKIIFCSEAPILGQLPGILILDSRLKIIGRISSVELGPEHVGNLIVFKKNGKLLSIDPQNIFSKLNNTNAAAVSEWITLHVGKAPPNLLKIYGISGGNLGKTFSSLINHKF
jgi:hypothetical protein